MISSEADFSVVDITPDDYLLLLASDGVWDELNGEEVFNATREFVSTHAEKGSFGGISIYVWSLTVCGILCRKSRDVFFSILRMKVCNSDS